MNATRHYPEAVDVAIVGSGPIGSTYARILSEFAPGATTAMFEVGPTVTDPPGAHVNNIADPTQRSQAQRRSEGPGVCEPKMHSPADVQGGERRSRPGTFLLRDGFRLNGEDGLPLAAMSSNVGGMAAHWTAACPRPRGRERVDFLPDLADLLDEAERLLGVRTDAFDASPLGDLVRARLAAAVDAGRPEGARVQRMPLAVHRRDDGALVWSGADVVMGDVTRRNARFSLFDESLVTRVLVDHQQVLGVELRDLRTGTSAIVRARYVVVAADALRTPQLLWASGIRPAALGHYLNDQPQVVFAARLRDVNLPAAAAPRKAGGLSQTSGISWVPFTNEVPFHCQVMQFDSSPVPIAGDHPVLPGSIVGLGLFCAKEVRREDRLEFADEQLDAYGMPAIRVHYRLTERDHEVLQRAQQASVRMAEALGQPLDEQPYTLPPGASMHYQGTTRMGSEDDGETVCGSNCQVWGVHGLYVGGNGVIPTATSCNPTLTSVAFAVRGARDIASALATTGRRATTTEKRQATRTARSL